MFVHSRHARILDHLGGHPRASVADLQKALGVSRSTLRRDLVELEEQGRIVRVHGGVVHRDVLRGESTLQARRGAAASAKSAIARAASAGVEPGQVVYVDAGSTCLEVARLLMQRDDIRLMTHSLAVLGEAAASRCPVLCIGGEVRAVTEALVGALAMAWLEHVRVDVAFIGASGLDREQGASTTELTEASVKRAVLGRCGRAVLVADGHKWGHPAAVNFAPWSALRAWVTDMKPPAAAQRGLRAAGVEVVTVSGGGGGGDMESTRRSRGASLMRHKRDRRKTRKTTKESQA